MTLASSLKAAKLIACAAIAFASQPAAAAAAPSARALFHLAQTANVLCQKVVDGRYIHRRVQTPDGCFLEVIDTYTGKVVSRDPAPCTSDC